MNRCDFDAIVIGAGMTGIGAGYYLGQAGLRYAIVEAKAELGGVWHTHRWHGVRCDSDVIKYSYSFQPYLADECLQSGAQLRAYLRSVAQAFGILEHMRFRQRVMRAEFDSRAQRWAVVTDRGTLTARFLVNGNGYFSDEPFVPAFEGAGRFRGEIVHTAQLDGARRFDGKRVVVVGSGATAICCAPELARVSASLVLLQRSPSYIYETDNRAGPVIRACQALYRKGLRFPVRVLRRALQLRDDLIFVGFRRFPRLARWFFRRHWQGAVDAEAYRRDFTPRYNPWEQRIPVAIGFKEALRAGRLRIKTARLKRFEAHGIVLEGGERLACDVCVLATGLNLRFFGFDIHVDSRPVALERINFFKGFMLGGIPNYFHPMGSWHSAWTQRMEPLMRLSVRIMRHMARRGLGTVCVERREIRAAPGITPNYVLRSLATMPRLEGTVDLPSVDNLLELGWLSRRLRFAA
jgi:cation diffusion facilitator CzcD-associated flavoprotein CzcO